jgi:hypothetical protein
VRKKIDPCLKLIRFKEMDSREFAQLSYAELQNCFTLEEKFAIVTSIALQDWNLMPVQFTPQNKESGARLLKNVANAFRFDEVELEEIHRELGELRYID